MIKTLCSSVLPVLSLAGCLCGLAKAELPLRGSRSAPPMITERIEGSPLVVLPGHVRGDLTADRDLGPVEDSLPLRLYLVLRRSREQQAALDNLLARQRQPSAEEYHKWLTPQTFGERFGASRQDIQKLTAWLESKGLHVNSVLNSGLFIDFSATAGDVREVFGSELHSMKFGVNAYPVAVRDPLIPAAMAGVVAAIEGLNKVPPSPAHTGERQAGYDAATHRWYRSGENEGDGPVPAYAVNHSEYDVTPQDFYTIYNVNPIFNGGNLGAAAAVAVIEPSDMQYGTVNATTGAATGGDVATFRTLFGVPGTLNMHVYHGYGTVTCTDPGVVFEGGSDVEASVDAEWANALAPAANLIFMSCQQGDETSELALIDNNLADVMSLSFIASELGRTPAEYAAQDAMYAQAAAQGQTIVVCAGDSGSDANDQNTSGTATNGINVNAYGSPMVTVTGGTDFSDQYDSTFKGPPQATYWNPANAANYGDARGYIPETAWNANCAGSLYATWLGYSGADYCALGPSKDNVILGYVAGGSGGFSTHYTTPAYQTGIPGYSGTMRAQPDISAFASLGPWGHALIYCDSRTSFVSCASASTFGAAGGTSFVAPQFAGVTALLVTATGTRQGMLNPALYALARTQFTAAATESACYSNGQTANAGVTTGLPAAGCIFNDVTTGNNDVPCEAGSLNCYVDGGATYGMLSLTGGASLTVAYPATPGYDEATGIGTVNVANLLNDWDQANVAYASTTTLAASLGKITLAQSTTLTAKVTVSGGEPGVRPATMGTVSFADGAGALGSCTVSAGACSVTLSGGSLALGANSISATFAGDSTYPSSVSSLVVVTVASSTGPWVSLSPTSLSFGPETVGTETAVQTVTLTNTGEAALSSLSIAITGAGVASYLVPANSCGNTVAGASCTISVAFKPAATGNQTGSISLTDNAGNSPQTIMLSGTGTGGTGGGGVLSVTPSTLTFGSENALGTTAGQIVQILNSGTGPLTITGITLSGAELNSFLQLNTCPATLAAGASCAAMVSFHPAVAKGAFSGSLEVSSSAGSAAVAMSGTGTATPTLVLSAAAVTFPTTALRTHRAAMAVTVSNTGTTNAVFGNSLITGSGSAAFARLTSCGGSLARGASCSFFVGFNPTAAVSYAATLEVLDNALDNFRYGYQEIALSGKGAIFFRDLTRKEKSVREAHGSGATGKMAPAGAGRDGIGGGGILSVTPSALSFGSESVYGATRGQLIHISNNGTAALTISGEVLSGGESNSFAQLSTCPTTLAAGASCAAMVSFGPAASGPLSASFGVTSSAGSATVALSGFGTAAPALSFSTAAVTFPTTTSGSQSSAIAVTVTNTGTTNAALGNSVIGGSGAAAFSRLTSCGTSLAAGASCSFFLGFNPTAAVSYSATLEVFDATRHGYQEVMLSGMGK